MVEFLILLIPVALLLFVVGVATGLTKGPEQFAWMYGPRNFLFPKLADEAPEFQEKIAFPIEAEQLQRLRGKIVSIGVVSVKVIDDRLHDVFVVDKKGVIHTVLLTQNENTAERALGELSKHLKLPVDDPEALMEALNNCSLNPHAAESKAAPTK